MTLPLASSGAGMSLRGRGPLVLLTLHPPGCVGCARLLDGLTGVAEEVKGWGGRLAVVRSDIGAVAQESAIPVLVDRDAQLATRNTPSILIADEWGEVHFAAESEGDHELITPGEVLDWVRFVAIQCPECEGPEGEWRAMQGE